MARTHWLLEGKLLGTSVQDIQSQLQVLQLAYATDDRSAVLLDNSGRATDFIVDTTQTVGGVIVTNPVSHDRIAEADGITYLKYTVGLSWDVLWASNDTVLSFHETLSFSDNQGFPLQMERTPLNYSPIIQNVSQGSFFYATQSGEMRQAGPNPSPPSPTFPGLLRGTPNSHEVRMLPVETVRGTPISYGVAWKYDFVNTVPFSGTPNYR